MVHSPLDGDDLCLSNETTCVDSSSEDDTAENTDLKDYDIEAGEAIYGENNNLQLLLAGNEHLMSM